jgi:chitinase
LPPRRRRENSPRSDQVPPAAAPREIADTTSLTDNWYESAPYYSVLDSDAPDLGTVMAATGQKGFDMAFILADGSSCTPAWNGTDPVSGDTQVAAVIN